MKKLVMVAALVGTILAGSAWAQGFVAPNQAGKPHISDVWNIIHSAAEKTCTGIVTTRTAPDAAPAEQQKDIEDCALVLTLHTMGFIPGPKG